MKTILLIEQRLSFAFSQQQNICQRRIHLYDGRIVRIQLWDGLDNQEYKFRFLLENYVLSSWCSPSLFSEAVDVSWPIPGFGGNDFMLDVHRLTSAAAENLDLRFIFWHEIERSI